MSGVRPAPVGIFTAKGVEANMLYVLAPARSGAGDPVKSVEAIEGDPRGARISFQDGPPTRYISRAGRRIETGKIERANSVLHVILIASMLAAAGFAAQAVDGHVVNAVTGIDIPGLPQICFWLGKSPTSHH